MSNEKTKKSMSIRLKLVCIIIPIVLVIIVSFFSLASNVVLKISQEKMQAEALAYAEEIGSWTNRILGELKIYQNSIEDGNFKNDAAVLKYLETTLEKNESYPTGLYLGDDKGVYLDGSGWVPGSDWILTERDWYVAGKDNEEFAFGEPYYDSMTGQVCVSASVRLDYTGATRVLATDVYLDYVSGLVSEISNHGNADAFLVTKNSQTIIAHVAKEMVALTLGTENMDVLYREIGTALAAGRCGIVSVNGNDGSYLACINPIAGTDWYLVTYVTEKNVLSELHQMEWIMTLIAVIATIVLLFAILHMMNQVVKPVKKMTAVIDRIAEGDFSHNLETRGNDEIARMSKNMQMFITQMQGTISEISSTAKWLEYQSVENRKVSDSLKKSSEKQSHEMKLLEQMVEQLSKAAAEASAQMDSLAEVIGNTHEQSAEADRLMKESVIMSQSGRCDMECITIGMGNINHSITELSRQMDKVGVSISKIGDMVNMIIDIAEETNLLSLNASIEAARAGEAGRGFSVVAEQIGKLALNSNETADAISKLTIEIKDTVEKAAEYMAASVAEVQANVGSVSEASDTFDGLCEKLDETSRRVGQMMELVGNADAVSRQMEEISMGQIQATEQIAQSAEELNQQTQNVTADSNTVAESAEKLLEESAELMGRISKFKV